MLDAHLNRLTLASYRPATILSRRKCLTAFEHSLNGRSLTEATRADVEAFLARNLAPESRRCYRNHLRSLYSWAVEEGYMSTDPTEKIPPIRVPKAQPRPIPEADLSTALAHARPKMRAWLTLMSLAGLRCIEVAALRPQDVQDTAAGPVLFLRECKGGGSAVMPCHPAILEALAPLPIFNDLWWTSDAAQVSRSVNIHLRRNGIQSTAHAMRHRAGTSFYRESGHDLLVTAALLRHSTVTTVQTYAALDPVRTSTVARLVGLPSAS
jgi:integrase